jgi:hypothetical protein
MIDLGDLSIDLAEMLGHGDGKSILIAGQALAFWGEYYLADSLSLAERSPLASRDIDFYNKRTENVKACVETVRKHLKPLGLEMQTKDPEMGDNAIALWFIKESAGPKENGVLIDFLDFISGIEGQEIERNSEEIDLNGKKFQVLSPVLCLKARVNNLIHLYPYLQKPADRMQNEEQRVRLAIQIVRAHLLELHYWVPDGEVKAKKRIKQITNLCNANLGKRLYKEYGICLMDSIPKEILDERFYKNTYKNTVEMLERYASTDAQAQTE